MSLNDASYQNLQANQPQPNPYPTSLMPSPNPYETSSVHSNPNDRDEVRSDREPSDDEHVKLNQNYAPQGSPVPPQGFTHGSNALKFKGRSKHIQALIATILLGAGILLGFYLNSKGKIDSGSMVFVFGGSYLVYLLVALCCNPMGSYLTNIDRGESFHPYAERVRSMSGRFEFKAECYHYETHYHTRTVTQNGKTRTENYTANDKVVTHSATEHLTPVRTVDESGPADRIRAQTSIVFIHFDVQYRFDHPVSSRNFEAAYENFKMRHRRDSQQDFNCRYEVPGLVERKAFYVGQLEYDFRTLYFASAVLGLLWPYCRWVESKIERFEITNMKVLTV